MRYFSLRLAVLSSLFLTLFAVSGCGIRALPMGKNGVEAAWAEVTNQYKRRADLIPGLVEVVKGYALHERETLEGVVEARAKATQMQVNLDQLNDQSIKQFSQAQGALTSALGRLMVVVEKYPDLKADQNFRDLQIQLEGTENRITIARQRYIESIKNFNNLVTAPPESITNKIIFHYPKMPQFTVENQPNIDQPPMVKF